MLISIVFLVLLIPILAIFLDSDLGKALARRLERGRRNPGSDALQDRISFLDGEVDRLSREVHRLEEESQFMQKLLEERSGAHGRSAGAGEES